MKIVFNVVLMFVFDSPTEESLLDATPKEIWIGQSEFACAALFSAYMV